MRYIQHPETLELVPADQYVRPKTSRVEIIGDSHYDGLVSTDGVDISSRVKHRRYMRERGLTTIDDFSFKERKTKDQSIKNDLINVMRAKNYV